MISYAGTRSLNASHLLNVPRRLQVRKLRRALEELLPGLDELEAKETPERKPQVQRLVNEQQTGGLLVVYKLVKQLYMVSWWLMSSGHL